MRQLLILFICGLFACQERNPKEEFPQLEVLFPVSLREAPREKSTRLEPLKSGALISDLGRTSNFVSAIYLNEHFMQEPWLLVKTSSGQQGWVYAGAVTPAETNSEQQHNWKLKKRFQAIFGASLLQRWENWSDPKLVSSDSAFSLQMREGLKLRDTLNQIMVELVTPDPGQWSPDMFWLSEMSPYFKVQRILSGAGYYLFVDFKSVLKTAATTSGNQDDRFAEIGCMIYPRDSIESAFPIWVFPLDMDQSCSNLGTGAHLRILQAIDSALKQGKYFESELTDLKNLLLSDILDNSRTYWQSQDKILSELKKIQEADLSCLDARDQLALKTRQKMFEQPEENKLKLNLRTGE